MANESQYYAGMAVLKDNVNAIMHEKTKPSEYAKQRLAMLATKTMFRDGDTLRMLGSHPQMQAKRKSGFDAQTLGDFPGPAIPNFETWEVAIEVDREDLLRDPSKNNILMDTIRTSTNEVYEHPYRRVISFLEAGTGTTLGTPGLDQLSLFNDSHLWPNSKETSTFNNNRTSNIGTPSAPTVAEVRAAFLDARAAFASFKDDQSNLLYPGGLHRKNLKIMCPVDHEDAFEQLLNSNWTLTSTTGGDNNTMKGAAELLSEAQLSNTDRFYVFNDSYMSIKPFIIAWKPTGAMGQEWEIDNTDPNGDMAKTTGKVYFFIRGKYEVIYGHWYKVCLHIFT